MDFNKPLNFKDSIFAIICILLFVLFVVSPAWTGGEPDKSLFILVWFIGAIFICYNLYKIFKKYVNLYLPERYSELKNEYGKPLKTIYPTLYRIKKEHDERMFYLQRMRLLLKFDIYTDYIIISFFNKAVLVKKEEILSVEDSGILGTTILICKNNDTFKFNLSLFQWTLLKKIMNL